MNTEICTSIEQSKKLLSLGLDPSTADMWYSYYGNSKYNPTIAYKGQQWFLCQIRNSLHDDIPCWSLTALLGLMPIGSHIEKKNSCYACYAVYTKPLEASTPIEAAFDAVCWLIEQKRIKVKSKTMIQEEKDNPEKKLFAKKGEWFKCIQVPKTHMQYKFNKYVQYCSNSDNCICDNSGEDVYIPTYIKDFESHFVKIILTK